MRWLRRIPEDVIALAAIALVVGTSHAPLIRHAVGLHDPSTLFALGHRVLGGAALYRDVAFPHGPLPVYVDAGFQGLLGGKLIASLYAALAVKVLRVWAVWLVVRGLADRRTAALVAVFAAFDPLFGGAAHVEAAYAELFAALAALWVVRGRLALASACAAAIAWALPGAGVVAAIAFAVGVRRGAVAAGASLGAAIVAIALLGGGVAWLPALPSGWALALPVAAVAVALAVARCERVELGAVAMLAVPIGSLVALFSGSLALDPLDLLPRVLGVAVTVAAAVAPERVRGWLGVEPVVAVALVGVPIACGAPAAVLGALVLALSSARLAPRAKHVLAAALALSGAGAFALALHAGRDPLAGPDVAALRDTRVSSPHPMLRGLRVTRPDRDALAALREMVPRGATCFVDADLPALYALLGCTNPTRYDQDALVTEPLLVIAALPDVLIVRGDGAIARPLLDAYDRIGGAEDLAVYRRRR
ncbi:MAG TPA: hypothetical protein VLX92_23125 [Kofleriaceae bacterium]|nr:hypothetical protein [Kofleriaceae bacterium]